MPREFPFPKDPESSDYCIFPPDLENDDHVFFHGTAGVNLEPILEKGFTIRKGGLPSVSFAKSSSLSLGYADEKRKAANCAEGCVIVVRYDKLDRPGLKLEHSILYDYTCDPQPEIIGFCIVPASYNHV